MTDKLARFLEAEMADTWAEQALDLEAQAEEDYWAQMVECDVCNGPCGL